MSRQVKTPFGIRTLAEGERLESEPAKPAQGHTPGPWTVAEYGIAELGAKYLCIKKGGKTVCRIDAQGNSASTNAQDEANARLIAAAPDLLAQLRDLAQTVECEPHGSPNIKAELQRAYALLDKAEGRAQ